MRWDELTESAGVAGLFGIQVVRTRTFDTPDFRGITFHEVHAKSIVNRVPKGSGMPFDWLNGVDPDHVPCVEGEPSLDSRTAKVAIPVLTSMADVLIGANTSLLLSAPDGTLLWRWDEDSRLRSRLNRSSVVIGTRWSEDVIGTNGLGTALETARAVTVNGTEHFNEALHDFACAGAPIRHPVTHRVTGVLSVTSLVEHASSLMAPTLLRLAHDIEEELYGETSMHECQMLRHFLAERRRTRSAVVVVSADVVIANSLATSMDLDHSALWQRIEGGPDDVIGLELSSGSRVTVCRPVHRGGVLVGAVVVAEEMPASAVVRPTPTRARDARRQERPWIRVIAQLRSTASTTDRLLVVGEHGTGKRAALRAAVADSDRAYRELDCATVDEVGHDQWLAAARALLERVDELLVLAHLDDLDDRMCRALAGILDRAPRIDGSDLRLAATVSAAAFHNDLLPRVILDQFPPLTFEIPPLRKRTDDALARLVDQGVGMPRLSHEVIQAVQRHPWPGNHRQLEEFRRWLTCQNRSVVTTADLPPAWLHEVTRGHLTAMQTAESDAIATALREHGGNKAAAATALGISRSSLYRKLREYRLR